MPSAHPHRNFNFLVEIDGIERAAFSEATLPSAELEVVEYREGADKTSVFAQAARTAEHRQPRPEARYC